MKELLTGLTLILSIPSFASNSEMQVIVKKNANELIEKGVNTGEIYSYSRSKLGATVEYQYEVIRVNDRLRCFSPLPMSNEDSFQVGLLGFPMISSAYCVATIDTTVY